MQGSVPKSTPPRSAGSRRTLGDLVTACALWAAMAGACAATNDPATWTQPAARCTAVTPATCALTARLSTGINFGMRPSSRHSSAKRRAA